MCNVRGAIFPLLTYNIPGVNRFVIGFIVVTKLIGMIMVVMLRRGDIDTIDALISPLIFGAIAGIIFMAWTKMKALPFVLGCSFIGASQIAPTLAKYVQQIQYGFTGDIIFFIDPIDIILRFFKIELANSFTLIAMLILLPISIFSQIKYLRNQGYDLDSPLIAFETDRKEDNGKVF